MQFNLMGFLGKESFSWSEPAGGLMAMFVRARTKQILGPQLLSFASSFSAFKMELLFDSLLFLFQVRTHQQLGFKSQNYV